VPAATSSAAATFPRISVSSKSGSKVNSFALSFIVVGTAIAVVVVVKGSLIVVVGITRSQIGSNYHENCVAGRQQKKGLKKYKYSVLIQSQAKSRGLLVFFFAFSLVWNESRKRKLVFGILVGKLWFCFGLALNFILRCAVVSVCQKTFNQMFTYYYIRCLLL